MKLLVTGGAGFIGSAVCRQAIADGDEVVNIDNFGYAATAGSTATLAANPAYAFIRADINDRGALDRIFAERRPDAVIHLAAESHVDRSINDPEAFVQTNVVGTLNLLQASLAYFSRIGSEAQEKFRFLHVSTDEVYGSLGAEDLFSEDTVYDPRSPYSASKAASDHLVSAWRHTFKLPTLISNCSNNYGPFQFPEKLIPLTIINALEGSVLPVYGDGGNIRDWLYVHDHVRALLRILRRGEAGQTYNVGGRNERTNLSVVHTICDYLDELRPTRASRRSLIRFVEDRPGHDRRYAVDATKLETELGWSADETFNTGIAKTIEWYLANESWWRPLRARYVGDRLGLAAN